TNRVSAIQESVVYGMSYTDEMVNVPKGNVLAGVAILGTIWMIVALIRGKLRQMAIPVIVYIVVVIAGQGASMLVQNFVVSPNEFAKEKPYLQHNLDFTKDAYKLSDIEEKENPGNIDSFDEEL